MRASMGNALLLNIVLLIVSAVMILFVSVIAYAKAYRVKNRIIEIIEKNNGYNKVNDADGETDIEQEIGNFLHQVGYKIGRSSKCAQHLEARGVDVSETTNIIYNSKAYNYCVGKKSTTGNGAIYVVITYIDFNFPIVGNILEIPVSGETKTLGIDYSSYDHG